MKKILLISILSLFPCVTFAAPDYFEFITDRRYDNASFIEFSKSWDTFFTAKKDKGSYVGVYNFEETPNYESINYFYFSQTHGNFWLIWERKWKQFIFTQWKESEAFDKIDALYFSDDGKKYAYIAQDWENTLLFIDGENLWKYRKISNFSFLDESWEKYSFVANEEWEDALYSGKERMFSTPRMSTGKFSSSWDYAYVSQQETWRRVISSLWDSEIYDVIWDLILSPDGKWYAFTAWRSGEWLVVINREEYGWYDSSYLLQYSNTSDNFVFIGQKGSRQILVKNREELWTYEKIHKVRFLDDRTIECISSRKWDILEENF